ncbi:MAG: hypothetical protein R6U65_06155 [Perlabentimonas sp.]
MENSTLNQTPLATQHSFSTFAAIRSPLEFYDSSLDAGVRLLTLPS